MDRILFLRVASDDAINLVRSDAPRKAPSPAVVASAYRKTSEDA